MNEDSFEDYEIEVKVLNIDKDEIIRKIKKLGGEFFGEKKIYDKYFEIVNNSLKGERKYLRLRKEGNEAFLTYKEHISSNEAKKMIEIETKVGDFNILNKILINTGFKEDWTSEKKRTKLKLGDIIFDIDELGVIPPFMEIEAKNVNDIFEIAERLSIPKENLKPWGRKKLLEYYGVSI